jgi:prefoldin subunit 5
MTRKIKAKANAMVDADVNYISLVARPASRIPFRLTKSDDPEMEAGLMIHLKTMFKRDGAAPKGCTLVGVVLQKQHEEHFAPQIKELGLKIDDRSEDDDVVILKQEHFTEDGVTAIKLGEIGGLFINVPEQVTKAFDPYISSDDFDENMALGFLPGMSIATDALMDTVIQVLRTAEDPDDAKDRIESNIDKYKTAILDLANNLPTMAFKLEGLNLEGFVEKGEGDKAADDAAESTATESTATEQAAATEGDPADAEPDAAPASEDKPAADDAAAAAQAEGKQPAAEDTKPAETAAPAAKTDPTAGLSDEEKQKLKGVHIEDLDVAPDPWSSRPAGVAAGAAAGAAPAAESTAPEGTTEKSETSEAEGIAGLLTAFKSEVLEAISSVKSEVSDLKSKQADLTEKVNTTAAIADRAQKAVKRTVPSNSDAGDRVRDESLGTRARQKGENTDERTWGGTALDRIVGDFGTGE